MICKHCGKENVDDAVFCRGCGNKLEDDKTSRETVVINQQEIEKKEEARGITADDINNYEVDEELIADEPTENGASNETERESISAAEGDKTSEQDTNEPGLSSAERKEDAGGQAYANQQRMNQAVPRVCPRCGGKNAPNAAFCNSCGLPLNGRARQGAYTQGFGKRISDVIKGTFKKQDSFIEHTKKDSGYWSLTLIALGIQSLLSALLVMLQYYVIFKKANSYSLSYMMYSANISAGDFFGMFIGGFVCDFALISSVYLFGKAFGGRCSFATWLSAAAPGTIMFSVGAIIAQIFLFLGYVGIVIACTVMAAGMVLGYVLLWKAFDITQTMDKTKKTYAFACGIAAFMLVIVTILMVMIASAMSSLYGL